MPRHWLMIADVRAWDWSRARRATMLSNGGASPVSTAETGQRYSRPPEHHLRLDAAMRSMKEAITSRTYDLWSKFYDGSFGRLVERRQRAALAHLPLKSGDRVLDMGVGTGMTLPHYPRDVNVVGFDLSQGMLAEAAAKCRQLGLDHCRLVRGDAMFPPFAPGSFDHIVICHTISVVSDPTRLLQWAAQLVKPGGKVVVLNHFQSTRPLMAALERWFNPMFVKIGWRSDLALEDVLEDSGLTMTYGFKLRCFDIWRIVVLEHTDHATAAAAAHDDRTATAASGKASTADRRHQLKPASV
jgi:phosphatidylethanolamine/phosphatidyl-N-methylethanolamine N-methyltransferase